MIRWTSEPEKLAFMLEFIPGHQEHEIKKAFFERFGIMLTDGQIGSFKTRHKVRSGTNGGRFKKGHVSHNKGKTLTPEQKEKIKGSFFKKGHVPANKRSVGSERLDTDGYIKVKIAEPDKWEHKHKVIWEQANGPVPEGCVLIFEDGNSTNCNLENIKCISRQMLSYINKKRLYAKGKVETFELLKQLDESIREKEAKE